MTTLSKDFAYKTYDVANESFLYCRYPSSLYIFTLNELVGSVVLGVFKPPIYRENISRVYSVLVEEVVENNLSNLTILPLIEIFLFKSSIPSL